jgi:hypothetical protein
MLKKFNRIFEEKIFQNLIDCPSANKYEISTIFRRGDFMRGIRRDFIDRCRKISFTWSIWDALITRPQKRSVAGLQDSHTAKHFAS